jgi:serine/threonine protein kinase/formylglycine-generating enzyme required for sulfatase activity
MPLPLPLAPGTLLGDDFTIREPIAAGGMGVVYRAEQRSTGRVRALKVMQLGRAGDAVQRRRFLEEARVGARIPSEHVVEVIAAGDDEASGLAWLAMELLQGEDLGAYVERNGRLGAQEAGPILAELCHALAAAHSVGVVHRDIKPANVFLARSQRREGGVVVKVLDFGLAKVAAEMRASLTGGAGTPLWMAPEQAELDDHVSPVSDVWALGLLVFYVLTGETYWLSAPGAAAGAILREVMYGPLPPASDRLAAIGGGPALPEGFDAWFARCVHRDRAARYSGAGEAWAALALVLRAVASGAMSLPTLTPLPEAPSPGTSSGQDRRLPPPATDTEGVLSGGRTVLPPSVSSAPRMARRFAAAAAMVLVGGLALLGARSLLPSRRLDAAPSTAGMVRFQGGVTSIGSREAFTPVREVRVAAFALDVTEVTMRDYRACVDKGRCTPALGVRPCTGGFERPDHPVNCVALSQARLYCSSLGKRLPTEEEWELAARGKELRPFPWGSASPEERQVCWNALPKDIKDWSSDTVGTCAVGASSGDITPDGLKDMGGNVSEWTESRYCPYGEAACSTELYVTRGGNWMLSQTFLLYAAARLPAPPEAPSATIGFRCAVSL